MDVFCHYSLSSYAETPSEDWVLVQKHGLWDQRRQAGEGLRPLYRPPVFPWEWCGVPGYSTLGASFNLGLCCSFHPETLQGYDPDSSNSKTILNKAKVHVLVPDIVLQKRII